MTVLRQFSQQSVESSIVLSLLLSLYVGCHSSIDDHRIFYVHLDTHYKVIFKGYYKLIVEFIKNCSLFVQIFELTIYKEAKTQWCRAELWWTCVRHWWADVRNWRGQLSNGRFFCQFMLIFSEWLLSISKWIFVISATFSSSSVVLNFRVEPTAR